MLKHNEDLRRNSVQLRSEELRFTRGLITVVQPDLVGKKVKRERAYFEKSKRLCFARLNCMLGMELSVMACTDVPKHLTLSWRGSQEVTGFEGHDIHQWIGPLMNLWLNVMLQSKA